MRQKLAYTKLPGDKCSFFINMEHFIYQYEKNTTYFMSKLLKPWSILSLMNILSLMQNWIIIQWLLYNFDWHCICIFIIYKKLYIVIEVAISRKLICIYFIAYRCFLGYVAKFVQNLIYSLQGYLNV